MWFKWKKLSVNQDSVAKSRRKLTVCLVSSGSAVCESKKAKLPWKLRNLAWSFAVCIRVRRRIWWRRESIIIFCQMMSSKQCGPLLIRRRVRKRALWHAQTARLQVNMWSITPPQVTDNFLTRIGGEVTCTRACARTHTHACIYARTHSLTHACVHTRAHYCKYLHLYGIWSGSTLVRRIALLFAYVITPMAEWLHIRSYWKGRGSTEKVHLPLFFSTSSPDVSLATLTPPAGTEPDCLGPSPPFHRSHRQTGRQPRPRAAGSQLVFIKSSVKAEWFSIRSRPVWPER